MKEVVHSGDFTMLENLTATFNGSIMTRENVTCRKIPFSHDWRTAFDSATAVGILLALVSLAGNILTVIQIRTHRLLHTPTYTAILCLAVSDAVAVVFRFVKFRAKYLYALIFQCIDSNASVFDAFVAIFAFTSLNSSYFHLVMLKALRYYIIACPLKSYSIVTSNKIVRYSVFCWTSSAFIGAVYGIKAAMSVGYIGEGMTERTSLIIEVGCVFYFLAITLIPFLTLHVMKIRKMHTYITMHHRQERMMHTMMVGICVTTVVCLIVVVAFCVYVFIDGVEPFYLSNVAQMLFFVNHAFHPIFYFLFSEISRYNRCRRRGSAPFDSSTDCVSSFSNTMRLRTFHREESLT